MTSPSLQTEIIPSSEEARQPIEVKCKSLNENDNARWDQFVIKHPQGTFFHLTAWKRVLEKTFKHKAEYVFAERNGQIVAVVPIFRVSNWILGTCLVSSPLAAYGGILASDETAENALIDHIQKSSLEQQVDYLELRYPVRLLKPGFIANTRYSGFALELKSDPETQLKSLPKDIRYMIRKAEKSNLKAKHGQQLLGEFYKMFAINMKRLGTPVFPFTLFKNLFEEFGEKIDVTIIYAGDQPVASAVSFLYLDTFHPYYIGGLPVARDIAANNYLWWELMKFACQLGVKQFDFGRSKKGTGAYAFKKKWAPRITDLDYQVYLVKRTSPPNFSPANPKFEIATRIWSRLPLWLANRLGPRIVEWFP
jgi:FemAB-related protein (PEP-CTERM system-associated)